MSDFLTRLARRAAGEQGSLEPRAEPMYANRRVPDNLEPFHRHEREEQPQRWRRPGPRRGQQPPGRADERLRASDPVRGSDDAGPDRDRPSRRAETSGEHRQRRPKTHEDRRFARPGEVERRQTTASQRADGPVFEGPNLSADPSSVEPLERGDLAASQMARQQASQRLDRVPLQSSDEARDRHTPAEPNGRRADFEDPSPRPAADVESDAAVRRRQPARDVEPRIFERTADVLEARESESPASPQAEQPEPSAREHPKVHIEVGRVEIRSKPADKPAANARPQHRQPEGPRTTLSDYLSRRRGGDR